MAKSQRDRWQLGPHVRVLKRCVSDEGRERTFRNAVEALLRSTESPEGLTCQLHGLGAWGTARGLLRMLKGDAGGVALVCGSWRYTALHVAVTHALTPPKKLSWHDLNTSARCLLFALALKRDRFASWLGAALQRVADAGPRALEDARYWSISPIERFSLAVFGLWSGRPVNLPPVGRSDSKGDTDLAASVLASWHDEGQFSTALDGLLRLRMTTANSDSDPFDDLRDGLLPVEFLAINRVRDEQGLCVTMPAHPMLAPPLIGFEWADGEPDELLTRSVAFCEQSLPGLHIDSI